jgi:hypothetical protein
MGPWKGQGPYKSLVLALPFVRDDAQCHLPNTTTSLLLEQSIGLQGMIINPIMTRSLKAFRDQMDLIIST